MKSETKRFGAVALLAVALLGVAFVGAASAETVSLPQNETFSVSNDTEELRAVGENASGELTVTVYNATNSSDLIEVTNGTLNATDANGGSDTYSFTAIDAENVSHYKLSVTGDYGIESLVLEKVTVVSGGGGLVVSDDQVPMAVAGVGLVLVLGVGGLALNRWY